MLMDDDDGGYEKGAGRNRKQLDVDDGNVFSQQSTKHDQTSESTFINRFYDFVSRYTVGYSHGLSRPLLALFFDSVLPNGPAEPLSFFFLFCTTIGSVVLAQYMPVCNRNKETDVRLDRKTCYIRIAPAIKKSLLRRRIQFNYRVGQKSWATDS